MATRIQAYVRMLSKPAVEITAAGTYGSTITSYRATLDGVTYTTASFTGSKKLSSAGEMMLTVTVTDTRGRNGVWTQCAVFYCNAGSWVQVAPYYYANGSWIQV